MIRKNNLPKVDKKALKSVSKKGLKTMQKNRGHHPMRSKGRVIKYGASGFARNIWLSTAATVVMAFTLIILFVTVVASVILNNTAELMREKIDITIYLKPNTADTTLEQLSKTIKKDANVKSVEVSTSEEEFGKFIAENKDNEEILAVLNDEEMKQVMIAKMQSTMRIKVYNVDNLESIKELVANDEGFIKNIDVEKAPTYDVNQTEIATITSWANIARAAGIILGVVFLVVSVLIIFSTIRMAIFSRREEIYMMKLVGADKSFIRGPFLVEAEICGIIAGLVAATICCVGFHFLAPQLAGYGIDVSAIANIIDSKKVVIVYILFVFVGIVIGRISARLAVSRYLNKA